MKTTHIFFISWPGFHWFFDDFSGIHGYFGRKNWKPWVVFMKPDKKQYKLSGATLSSRASAPALGPSAAPESFQFIFLSGFMKPPKVSIFPAKNIRETTETIKKMNETRSQKKTWFLFKTFKFCLLDRPFLAEKTKCNYFSTNLKPATLWSKTFFLPN